MLKNSRYLTNDTKNIKAVISSILVILPTRTRLVVIVWLYIMCKYKNSVEVIQGKMLTP